MNKHSPGPWKWRRRAATPDLRDATGATLLDEEYDPDDGRVTLGADGDEGAANARLVEAAPEMLELLREYARNGWADGGCVQCAHWTDHASDCKLGALLKRIGG